MPAVIAPREPTLFRGTSYGLSVWVAFLLQVRWLGSGGQLSVRQLQQLQRGGTMMVQGA